MSQATLADAIPNEECFTIEDLAEEFDLSTLRVRQIIDKAIKGKHVQNLVKKEGRRVLYAPQMVEQLKSAVDRGLLGKFRKKNPVTALKYAKLVLQVPIFDEEISTLVKRKFESDENIVKFLQDQLSQSVKPILAKKRELEARFDKEMQQLLHSNLDM